MGAFFKSAVAVVMSVCGICCAASASAEGFATIGLPPQQSASTGLPDGRVYEQASPADKHGYNAGAEARAPGALGFLNVRFSIASANGNAVAYRSGGPAAEVNASGLSEDFVAERTTNGWRSRSSAARVLRLNEEIFVFHNLVWADYSPDLSHLAYQLDRSSVAAAPIKGSVNTYLMGSNPLERPIWLLQSVASPSMGEGGGVALLGMTPDASVVYFAYASHLMPQDASRSGWGVYESRQGEVREIGVLPDGSVPASGAFPVAAPAEVNDGHYITEIGEVKPASSDNQVSEDGKRLFFFSSGQLYVHKLEADGSESTVLVSASQLPGHVGEAASDGVSLFENRTRAAANPDEFTKRIASPTYAYASPDGSNVVFQSVDRLTSTAPGDASMKVYDFDVEAGTLEYLPDVTLGGVVTAAKDGSWFLFVSGTSELKLWTEGPGGGQVRQIAELPEDAFVGPGRAVADGSVVVFQAEGPLPGVSGSAEEQIYRYEIASNVLRCISCPSHGVAQSGNAYLAASDQYVFSKVLNDPRGVSSDGNRIFFASPNPLVSRDTNGDYDTYEWEDGKIFLISSGSGSDYSLFLDNSESGGDVFFATADELVEGDNDGGFDVYDARIPRPGDNPSTSAVPCSGDVCQGPPSVSQLLGAPASAAFSGAENLVEEQETAKPRARPTTSSSARRLAVALRACRKSKLRSRRKSCEKQARKRYAPAGARAKHYGGRGQ